jgi:hypothetical protein
MEQDLSYKSVSPPPHAVQEIICLPWNESSLPCSQERHWTYSSLGNKHLNIRMSAENYIEIYLLLTEDGDREEQTLKRLILLEKF